MDSRLELRIPPDARHARTVREAIMGFAALNDVDDADLEALLFAVGEALANAIEHAQAAGDIEVITEVDETRVVATVMDYGRGFSHIPQGQTPLPDALAERGRGIPIMQRCTDFFHVRSVPGGGTTVILGRLRRGVHDRNLRGQLQVDDEVEPAIDLIPLRGLFRR